MKRATSLALIFAIAFALAACSRRSTPLIGNNLTDDDDQDPPVTSDCPNGLSAIISLVNPSALIAGQAIQFQVVASGCKYDYNLYVQGQAVPIRFSGTTTFSQTFPLPINNVQASASVVALNASGQPVAQFVALSPSFNVSPAPENLSCTVVPSTFTVNVPVNAQQQPVLTAPPALNLSVNSSLPAKVMTFSPPSEDYLELSSGTPIPSASFASTTSVMAQLKKLSGGSINFSVRTQAGTTASCAGTVAFNFVPLSPGQSVPQFLFRGDVTGDGMQDIVVWDSVQKIFWVAKAATGGVFTYENFGMLAGATLTDGFLSDFNADGKADLLVRVQGGMWKLGFSSGSQFTFADLGAWPASPVLSNLMLEDVNGDGRMDLVGMAGAVSYVSYISITGMAGSIAAPVPKIPVLSFSANPTNVAFNGSTTLSWNSSNASSCQVLDGQTPVTLPSGPNISGSYTATALRSNKQYTLRCAQAVTGAQFSSSPVNITVGSPPVAVLDIKVKQAPSDSAPDAVIRPLGGTVYLSWAAENVTSCTMLRNDATISSSTSSPYIQQTVNALTTFRLRCVSVAGTMANSPAISVQIAGTVTFNPSTPIDFGTVVFGSKSTAQKVVLSNPAGRGPITGALMVIPEGFEFAGGTCTAAVGTPFTLAGGANCEYLLKFAPAQKTNEKDRSYLAQLIINYHNGINDVVFPGVMLKGKGTKQGGNK